MTFDQYIDNPMGKSNAVFAARYSYKAEYTQKFDALFMREAGKIDRMLYYDKSHDVYYAHLKIPSESLNKFYYDVVIKFYTDNNSLRTVGSLKDYDIQFFSNDPAFIYTYMYVFLKHGMLIEDLKSKCPKASLTIKPTERNFYEVPGYVKSIYFAYLLMSRSDLFLKSTYHNFGKKYSKSSLLGNVSSGEEKMDERKRIEAKEKKIAKDAKTNKNRMQSYNQRTNQSKSNIKTVNTVKKVNTVGVIKPVNKVKRITKITGNKHK